jgi:hypothetical protein
MKLAFKLFVLCSLILTFSSCQDVVQVKLDEGSKLYVIDAFINNLRGDQVVKITSNSNYFSSTDPSGISGANVVLVDLTDNKQYNFIHSNGGRYVYSLGNTDTIAKVGHEYKLMVEINGDMYLATSKQKRPASIDSIGVELNDGSFAFGPPANKNDTTFNCILYAKDKADGIPDYYWIKTFRNDTLFSDPSDINLNIDGTGGEITTATVDSLEFTPPSTLLGFKSYRRNDRCRVEVHSIMKDTYNFFVQAQAQIGNGGLFATTPENVKTNLVSPEGKPKAVGWFSVSSVAMKNVLVK